MSTPPMAVVRAQELLAAAPAKNVLFLEGPGDLAVYPKWLDKLAPANRHENKLNLIDAGGKQSVLAALEWFRDHGGNPTNIFGLVDRDEWHEATINHWAAGLPHLLVNGNRHSLESYFCDPDEIEPSLLQMNTAYAGDIALLIDKINGHRARYVEHWALLTATDRLKNRMTEEGYPGHFANSIPVPPDADIRARFQQWAALIDADAAFNDYDQLRTIARAAVPSQAYRSHVWAWMFFEQVVCPTPHGLKTIKPGSSNKDWMIDLAEFSPQVPPDLAAILQPLVI